MLGSITPLGQRARGFRFWPTATAYVVASALAGTAVGAALGSLGAPILGSLSWTLRVAILCAGAIVGVALDLGLAGSRLPTVHRQVIRTPVPAGSNDQSPSTEAASGFIGPLTSVSV